MNAEWIKSPTGRLVLAHWADARPTWLWSQDGETLLWRNDAARYFHGRAKKHGVKLAPEAVPIKGQVARLIRLGSMNRPSLSRIQFLAGEKPISTTCTCTPLQLGDDLALLIVAVDPIDPELLDARNLARVDALTAGLLPPGSEHLLISEDGQITGGSPRALEIYGPIVESEGLPIEAEQGTAVMAGETVALTRFKASPHDAMLLVFERPAPSSPSIDQVRNEDGLDRKESPPPVAEEPAAEPLLPLGLHQVAPDSATAQAADEENWVEPLPEPPGQEGALASLFDRLADDQELYAPLGAADDRFDGPPPEPVETPLVPEPEEVPAAPVTATSDEPDQQRAPPTETPPGFDAIAALIADADAETDAETDTQIAADEPAPESSAAPTIWRLVGRGFTPVADEPALSDDEPVAPAPQPDAETVERVSRYNFDELSRILTDRVSGPSPNPQDPTEQASPERPAVEGALINLSGETFILNRLPLGILVFRDQQVLFANRALTDLTGYESIESLRSAGLTAIFPSEDVSSAGPVTQLVRRDGNLAAVNARLQSITWHGRPALMLSASAAENRFGHEAAVRAFAQLAAETVDDGFLSADTAGTVTSISLHGRIVLGATEDEVIGKPLASFIDPGELTELRQFLERPARFAETSRPAILFTGAVPNTRVTLFAQGQAGIVTGYFAFLRRLPVPAAPAAPSVRPVRLEDAEPSMLTRISRSVRRPLNTVIGFSDLIRSAAFGSIENQRYLEYAQDIRTAGQEIATLIDELDDYTRLKEGRYEARRDEIDLSSLLDASLARVRRRAGDARVLVRNAVSERLPRITADRASLSQAILNLLASAIDQTPAGGSVILSAQRDDDGSVVINVRDSGDTRTDLGERFVVFRDGVGKDGEELRPVQSSVGLALTRSLLAVNALSLSVDPAAGSGNLFSLVVPPDLVRD